MYMLINNNLKLLKKENIFLANLNRNLAFIWVERYPGYRCWWFKKWVKSYLKKVALADRSFLKIKIKNISESGIITSVKDGVAVVYGLQKGCAGEMVYTRSARNPNGMLLNLHRYYASLVIFGNAQYKYGTRVFRTRRLMGIPISLLLFGRVIDALGSVIDGGKVVRSKIFKQVDTKAIGIIDRQSVFEPMLTGLISVLEADQVVEF